MFLSDIAKAFVIQVNMHTKPIEKIENHSISPGLFKIIYFFGKHQLKSLLVCICFYFPTDFSTD